MFRGGLNRTGYNPVESELKPPLELKWARLLVRNIYSSSSILDGTLYVGGYRSLFVLDTTTGEIKWQSEVGGTINSSPAIASGVVFFGAHDGKLYALDARSGAEIWSYDIGWWPHRLRQNDYPLCFD